ncbi:MAG: hypothetical protein LBT98_04425 [Puniceicoccales bacterium]|jgi:hypothetical protein|nr:hypothetical protein [Puniceicoccales bacterium]
MVRLEDYLARSPYYGIFESSPEHYKAAGKKNSIAELLTLAGDAGDYETDRLYTPRTGGGYAESPRGEFLRRKDGSHVHVSQLYVPIGEVDSAIQLSTRLLAISFHAYNSLMAQMAAFLEEMEADGTKLRRLQDVYKKCTLLQSELDLTNLSSAVPVDANFLDTLAAVGLLEDGATFVTGPEDVRIDAVATEWWFGWDGGKIKKLYADSVRSYHPYLGTDGRVEMGTEGETRIGRETFDTATEEGVKRMQDYLARGMVRGTVRMERSSVLRSLTGAWQIRSAVEGEDGGGDGQATALARGTDAGKDMGKNPRDSFNRSATREFDYDVYDHAHRESRERIRERGIPAFLSLRELRTQMDVLRSEICRGNGHLEVVQQYLARTQHEIAGVFSLGSNLLRSWGEYAQNITRRTH